MQTLRTPQYVEHFDALDFPGVDVHTSSLEVPLLHEHVDLIAHAHGPRCIGACEFEWDVVRGDHRVALALVNAEIAHNLSVVEQEIGKWITEQQARDADALDWHQGWRAMLAAHPAVEAALSKGPDELFRRAELSRPQELAMRCLWAGASNVEAARQLGISEPSYRERIERAVMRIQELGTVAI